MSTGFAAIPNWIVEEPEIPPHEKLVYMVLSSKIGDQGAWFISHSEIGKAVGISTSSVQRALVGLRERGVVSWVERYNPDSGARLGNQYRLMVDRLGQGDRPPRSQGPTPSVSVTEQNKNPEKEPINTPPTPSHAEQAFDLVWSQWPNRKARKPALTSWLRATRGLKDQAILDLQAKVLLHAKAFTANTPPRFIPMLSTFLNQERWADPLAISETQGKYQAEPQSAPTTGPYNAQNQLVVPRGMRPVWDEVTGRFSHFEKRDAE